MQKINLFLKSPSSIFSKEILEWYEEHKVTIIISLLMIFATLSSIFIFGNQSLRLDEAQSLWQTSRSPLKILNIIAQDVHVPLYHMMLHYWQMIFNNDVITARLFSLIFFLLSIPAIYKLGKLVYGKSEGLFAALILTISPFMNWYGNEIRMYSLFTFLIILHQYFFVRLFKFEGERLKEYWFFYSVVSLFGIYTHYFFFLSFASQIIFYLFNQNLFQKGDFKRFLYLAIGLILAFSPWVYYVKSLNTISNSSPLLSAPTTVDVFNTFSQFLFGFQSDYINTALVSLWPFLVLLGFLALKKNGKLTSEVLYLLLAFLTPMIIAFLLSVSVRPLYLSRYLILTLPAFYLLISGFIGSQSRNNKKILKRLLIIIMSATLFMQAFSSMTPVKENYREVSDYLMENASATDIIAVSAPFTIYPVGYYYKGPSTITTLPIWDRLTYGPVPPFDINTLPTQVATITKDHSHIWLLLSYDQGYEEKLRLYFDTHYERLLVKNFSSKLNLYEYKLKY